MGIPYYFHTIIHKYKNIRVHQLPHIHLFFLDYNGIIHPVAHETILKDNDENNMFLHLWNKTLNLIKPYESSFIAIDGVAPLAKILQQRKRRYLSNSTNSWDTNNITCGTPFMNRLNKFIENKCIENNIGFSGTNDNGEGEHKLFEKITNIPDNHNILVHGLDADLIILSLISFKNIYLYRENNDKTQYIFISELRNAILNEWKDIFKDYNNDYDRIYTYCIICSLLGNDFLPHLLTINLRNNGMDKIKDSFKNQEPLVIDGQIQHIVLSNILLVLSSTEDKDLILELKNHHIDNFSVNSTWRKHYYDNISFIPDISQACKSYLDGIYWTYNYYRKSIQNYIDHAWYYPYYDAPSLKDLANFSFTYTYSPLNTLENFISNKIQLLIVIPKTSYKILDKNEQKYYIDDSLGLTYMYPSSFKLISFLKKHDWEHVPCLPLIDIEYIQEILA